MKHDPRAGRVQATADRSADALAATGDQHDSALHGALPDYTMGSSTHSIQHYNLA